MVIQVMGAWSARTVKSNWVLELGILAVSWRLTLLKCLFEHMIAGECESFLRLEGVAPHMCHDSLLSIRLTL